MTSRFANRFEIAPKIGCCRERGRLAQVAQLSGYVSEHSAYHHGETSLQSTIVGLAQNFVGSNNINLLVPSGLAFPC